MIRALFRPVKVTAADPPLDTLQMKVFYRAVFGDTPEERNSGVIPADPGGAPYPIVLFLPGINVSAEAYQWLAVALAEAGYVVVTYNWIASDMPGYTSLTPGVDIDRIGPDSYGSAPTCTAIGSLLAACAELNETGVLAGMLDLDSVVLGGHSAGGTMAFQNNNPAWWPTVRAAFAYAGHTMAATILGHAPGTILPVPGGLPTLLMGGDGDGVIAASSGRYGLPEGSATAALERTHAEAVAGDATLVIYAGANHFTCCQPADATTGRAFLETPAAGDETAVRRHMTALITAFLDHQARCLAGAAARMDALLQPSPLIAHRATRPKTAVDHLPPAVARTGS